MSNHLAVATVSAALQQILLTPVSQAVGSADVQFSRPDSNASQTPLVNIYLYQVTPNASARNADLPTRRGDGTLSQRSQAALDLHYLITFQGDDKQLEPQRLLGAVVMALNNQPYLFTSDITKAVAHFGFLAGSGLENQVERVKFTPTALSLEEFSKLWSVFFQVEYRLSVAYQASVVLLESDVTPQPAPPVLARNVFVTPLRMPGVDQVVLRPTITPLSLSAVLNTSPQKSPLPAGTKLTAVTLTVISTIGVGQRAILLLNSVSTNPPAAFTSLPAIATIETTQITFQIENVPLGTYLARIQVDGAESLLAVDPSTDLPTGPTVAMP